MKNPNVAKQLALNCVQPVQQECIQPASNTSIQMYMKSEASPYKQPKILSNANNSHRGAQGVDMFVLNPQIMKTHDSRQC